MFSVTVGTEKQVAYANDIIRKPIINVEKKIDEIEHDSAMLAEKYGQRNPQLDTIPILRDAIKSYEKTIDASADLLTAEFVIKNYKTWNMFQRTMWKCLSHAFREAGYDGQNVENWAAP